MRIFLRIVAGGFGGGGVYNLFSLSLFSFVLGTFGIGLWGMCVCERERVITDMGNERVACSMTHFFFMAKLKWV